jgi:WD40 repeat protein
LTGAVKTVQVENNLCLTGSADATVRVWDLRRVSEDRSTSPPSSSVFPDNPDVGNKSAGASPRIASDSELGWETVDEHSSGSGGSIRQGGDRREKEEKGTSTGACLRVLEGHTKTVTSLYWEQDSVVSSWFLHSLIEIPVDLRMVLTNLGDGCVRQDDSAMGFGYWTVRPHDGHPLGHIAPSRTIKSTTYHLRLITHDSLLSLSS